MTYVIEGKLTREEKPEKYMNQFIDFKLINDEKLFTIDDIERSIECNITITDGTWPLDDGS